MPSIHVPQPQIPEPPSDYTPQKTPEIPSQHVITVMMNGDEPGAETPNVIRLRERLSLAEKRVRRMDAEARVNGWCDLLRAEFNGVAGTLAALPADAQGAQFHAVFDQPVIGGKPSARLKLWYGQAADGARMINGQRMAAVQINDHDRVLVDCFDPASSAQTKMPRLDYSDSLADLVMDAREALGTWAERACGNKRGAEIRSAIKAGFGPK